MIPPWLIWTFVAVISWGCWAVLYGVIGETVSPMQSQALSTIGLVPIMVVLMRTEIVRTCPKFDSGSLFALGAGILTCIGNIAYYAVLNSGARALTIVPLTGLYPLVTVLLALIVLKESLNKIQISGVILSLVAIYFLNIKVEHGFFSPVLLIAMVVIVLWGVSGLLQKVATNSSSGELSTLWFLASFFPVGLLLWIVSPPLPSLRPITWVLIVLLGLTLGFGNFALLQAFAHRGKASVIAPLAGLYPVISVPLAMVFFKEKIVFRDAIGIGLALLAVAAISMESKAAPTNEAEPH
jgi:drug/metabolite transporter (DMT)-like permease